MMENKSYYTMLFLSKPFVSGSVKHIYLALTVIVYLLIIVLNFMLIFIIFLEKNLHDPMYIFLSNLCINGLYGTAGFYPKFLFDLFFNSFEISYSLCFLQGFVIYSSTLSEFTILTLMAFDRYIAICWPLYYHSIMRNSFLVKLILFSWIFPALSYGGALFLTNSMPLCGSHIDKLFCDNLLIMRLTCQSSSIIKIYGLVMTFIFLLMVAFIIYTYCSLILCCRKCTESKNKFMQTCVPHLLSLINFTSALLFDTMYSRYGSTKFSQSLYNFLTVEFLVFPPVFNPLIYGLKSMEVRQKALRLFIKLKMNDLNQ